MIWKVLSQARFKLISLPTPMEKLERISKELGVNLYVKRDDVMELCFGGNKARKLEFILGDALSKGANVLITRGATHSNHVRLTAAAARKAGLEVYAVVTPPGSLQPQGNILIDRILGANLVFVEKPEEVDGVINKLVEKLREEGKKPYVIPAGGASEHGILGYVLAALEILQQSLSLGFKPDYIIHATGTGATQAGLVLGLKLLGAETKVIGISIGRPKNMLIENMTKLANSTSKLFGLGIKVIEDDFTVYEYTFGGYGVITREVVDTIVYAARKEGLLLDPVYTAKAFYGLIDLVEKGIISKESNVLFIHTGGTPINFQYASEITRYLQ